MARYRCPHCKLIVIRDSRKAWIKSWCGRFERYVRLMRMVKFAPRTKPSFTYEY